MKIFFMFVASFPSELVSGLSGNITIGHTLLLRVFLNFEAGIHGNLKYIGS